MSSLLISEPPLQVLPSLAKLVGLNEAIILQQIHYWSSTSEHEYEGYKWIYNSYPSWQKQFQFWSPDTIKRAILKLEKEGYLVTGNFNKMKIDRTKWYRINYEKLGENARPWGQVAPTRRAACPDEKGSLPLPIPENTTENTTENCNIFSVQQKAASPRKKLTDQEWLNNLKENPAYKHINFDRELAKMDAWLSLPKNHKRQKTRAFILNWLSKVEGVFSPNSPDPPLTRAQRVQILIDRERAENGL